LAETAFDAVLATTAEFVAPDWPPERLGQLPVLISASDGWPQARHLSNRGPVEVLHEPLPVEVISLRLRLWTRQLLDRRWLRQATRTGTGGRFSNDHLTGVLAFGPAHEYLRRAMAAAPQERFALVLVDWTGVGPINRREGYAAGDRALIDFAEGVRGAVRAEDVPARLGAAAFAVVAAGLEQDAAEAFALRLLGAGWQAARAVGDERVARVGVVWPRADEEPADAVQRARDACRTIYWDRLGGVERTTLLAAV
jgi:diguanylate cyclase (GGDEF)-like protein